MIIRIKQKQTDPAVRSRRFSLYIPLSVFKWRIFQSRLPEKAGMQNLMAPEFIDALKAYKRQHGHWTLVEIETADGEKINIEI